MFVYLVTNKINGKQYIGQTTATPVQRWRGHLRTARTRKKHDTPLYSAIRKYGSDSFCVATLASASNQDDLNQKERDFIAAYFTMDRDFGYNRHEGGNVPPRGTSESNAKGAAKRVGQKRTPEARQKMSEAAKKRGAPWLMGVPKSAETRAKIGAKSLGRKHSPEVLEKIRTARAKQKPIRWTEEQKQRFSALRKAHPTSSVFQKGHVFFPSKTEGVV